MAVHILVEFSGIGVERPDAVVDDAAVGLMADHPIQIIQRQALLVQHCMQTAGQGFHRKAEHGLAVHADGSRTGAAGPACMDGLAAPGPQRDGKGSIGQLENGRTCAITKQHAGGAVFGVDEAGKGLAAHHKGILPAHGRHQAPGYGSAVDKAGAGGVDIQCRGRLGQAESPLHLTGYAGGGIRGRESGADAAGDIRRGKAAAFQCLPGCSDGQRGGGFMFRAPVPGADAGAGGDPLIAGVHGAAQFFICDRAAGQCPAGGDQLQTVHPRFASPI